jgi:pyruvate kinase
VLTVIMAASAMEVAGGIDYLVRLAEKIIRKNPKQVTIVAPSNDPAACQGLAFSYGVHPVDLAEEPADWREFVAPWLRERGVAAEYVMLVAGPSPKNLNANHRIELMHLDASAP